MQYFIAESKVDSFAQSENRKKRKTEHINNFSIPVSSCTNYFVVDNDHKFVDLERVANECLSIVSEYAPHETIHTDRVPPLALMRFSRGGKTITLSAVFDKLKEDGRFNPILISFNGSGGNPFSRHSDETDSQAILRLIAVQLGYISDNMDEILDVDHAALDQHLGDNAVLLIDELNMLGKTIDNDAAKLLREMFLDKAGRYLVFTSHFPVSIDDKIYASSFIGTNNINPSTRMVVTVNMSLGSNLAELRGMSERCGSLTEQNAAWFGYVPSLIFCSFNTTGIYGAITPAMRFAKLKITVETERQHLILFSFVEELLTGIQNDGVNQYFGSLASVGIDWKVSYPFCYIYEIFKKLNLNIATVKLVGIIEKLQSNLSAARSGLAWECAVEVAIILKMLDASWRGTPGPFNLVPFGVKADLKFFELPDECLSITEARQLMEVMIVDCDKPSLIFVTSANAQFPEVEGFVVYSNGCSKTAKIIGFQMKTNDEKPRYGIDMDLINCGAVLIRGHVAAKKPREPKSGWIYMTSKEVRDFLGTSLLMAMPCEWLQDP